jgi:hypothetical protein
MPRRSNEFQRLVRVIYEQLVPEGATVRESALVKERDSEVLREVDILIELPVADVTVRLAVECRDHSRPADIGWIDELIGKYRDLPIDRVIAVSRLGFYGTVEEKAAANRIVTRSLSNALSSDWPTELATLTLARFRMDGRLTLWGLRTSPPWQGDQPTTIRIGDNSIKVQELVKLFERQLFGAVGDAILRRAKTAGLSPRWAQSVTVGVPEAPEAHAEGKDGFEARVVSLSFLFEGTTEVAPIPVERQLYGPVGITSGTIHVPELKRDFKVSVVQVPGKNIATPIIESLPGADQTYST